ncbi:hypothetical protein [Clostridium sp. DL1XJH146]
MTLKKYRYIDILLLTALAFVFEFLGNKLHILLPGAGFHLSFSILIAIIGIIRWGAVATIIYPISGLAVFLTTDSSVILEKLLLYPIANSFIILSTILFRFFKRGEIADNSIKVIVLTLVAYISVAIGKGFGTFILTGEFIRGSVFYLLAEMFNIIIVSLLLIFLRKKEGLLTDMNTFFSQNE